MTTNTEALAALCQAAANDQALPIGEAWRLLDDAAAELRHLSAENVAAVSSFLSADDERLRLRAERDALVADAERWRSLYRRAINEANGLTNYVEERPELRRAERKLEAIELEARAIEAAHGISASGGEVQRG